MTAHVFRVVLNHYGESPVILQLTVEATPIGTNKQDLVLGLFKGPTEIARHEESTYKWICLVTTLLPSTKIGRKDFCAICTPDLESP